MSHSQRPKGSLGKKGVAQWDYQEVPNKSSVVGWKAGDPFGVYTHYIGKTIPCKRELTKSKLCCPYCEAGEEPIWRGYTPFFDQDYCRKFVLIGEDIELAVTEITHHAQIRVSRGKGSREGVKIRADNWRLTPLPELLAKMPKVDLFWPLIRVWKDPELTQWATFSGSTKPDGTGVGEVPKLSDDPALKNLRERQQHEKEKPEPAPAEKALDGAMNRIGQRVSKNGKH